MPQRHQLLLVLFTLFPRDYMLRKTIQAVGRFSSPAGEETSYFAFVRVKTLLNICQTGLLYLKDNIFHSFKMELGCVTLLLLIREHLLRISLSQTLCYLPFTLPPLSPTPQRCDHLCNCYFQWGVDA